MSGPPSWLWWATAIAMTVGVAAVGVAVVSAGLDWMERQRGRAGAQEPAGAPQTQSCDSRAADPPSTGLREALSASTPQTRTNRSET